MPSQLSRRIHSISIRVAAAAALIAVWLAVPGPTAACSCVEPGPLALEPGHPTHAVFEGSLGPQDPRGVQLRVERWFHGAGAAQIVWLEPAGINGDSAACGLGKPTTGSRWIFVADRQPGSVTWSVNSCPRSGDLATPEGRALQAEALAAFPVPLPMLSGPANGGPGGTDALAGLREGILVGAIAVLVGLAALGLGVAVARRRGTAR
jgi:hypothetical protein